jgi:hypothetical protein
MLFGSLSSFQSKESTMRTISGMMFVVFAAWIAGCGKADSPGGTKTDEKPSETAPSGSPTQTPAAAWEMDPAKHIIPAGPVSGKMRGADIAPEVQVERDAIRFRTFNKEGLPIGTAVEIRLSDPSKSLEDIKLVVKPDQSAGIDVPSVIISNLNPSADAAAPPEMPKILANGYALTLNLGKRENGKIAGRVSLSLPDEPHSFLAGTFTGEWLRAREELPGPADAPFVHGKITVKSVAEPNVEVGYVRVDPAEPTLTDSLGTTVGPSGFHIRSETYRPRCINLFPATATEPARYEFTRLEPGRYLTFAKLKGGPAIWKWIDIASGSQAVVDFPVDTGRSGSLEITAPASATAVAVVPASEPGKPWPEPLVGTASSVLEWRFETAALKKADPAKPISVTMPRLAPGKYEVWAGELTSTVEVKPNEAAKVELKNK